MTLPAHHSAWLSVHSHRTRRWFVEKLKDGFDVHHLDGDHGNNEPSNLALIEHTDHMAIHNGGTHFLGRLKRNRQLRLPRICSRTQCPPIERLFQLRQQRKTQKEKRSVRRPGKRQLTLACCKRISRLPRHEGKMVLGAL